MESSESKLIMITGCNKGVGFGILENLAINRSGYKFLMAVRSLKRGEEAVQELKSLVHNIEERVTLRELDIANSASIDSFVQWIKEKGIKVDCLVNNAGIAIKTNKLNHHITKETFQTNFYGTVELTEKMLPLLPEHAKIINITTDTASFGTLKDPNFHSKLDKQGLTREELFQVAKEFEDLASKEPEKQNHPFPTEAYPVYNFSKLLVSVYTRLLASNPEMQKRGIQVYSCSPGWVKTDIGGPTAEFTIQEGSQCPCNIINMPYEFKPDLQGKFFCNSEVTPL